MNCKATLLESVGGSLMKNLAIIVLVNTIFVVLGKLSYHVTNDPIGMYFCGILFVIVLDYLSNKGVIK